MPEKSIELIKMEDGTIKRMTRTTKDKKFFFLGDEYTVDDLRLRLMKVYYNSYHEEVSLYMDKYGRMFIYTYIEEMNFSDGPDRVDDTYCLVKNESEADELSKDISLLHQGRMPYVYVSETGFVSTHEII